MEGVEVVMYRIYSDDHIVYSPSNEFDFKVTKATLNLALNESGTLSFTVPHTNSSIQYIKPMKSTIEVRNGDSVVFSGRVIRENVDIQDNHSYVCEGSLSYLHDTMIEPYAKNTDTVSQFLTRCINQHNAQCLDALGNTSRQLSVGTVSALDPQGICKEALDEYVNIWDLVKERLIDSDINGYFVPHFGEDASFDFVNSFEERNEQDIVYAKNILDIGVKIDCSNLYTAVMPVAKRDGDVDLTIAPLADGMIDDSLRKRGYNVENVDLIDEYGYIVKPIYFLDETDRNTLKSKAIQEMRAVYMPDVLDVSVVDLSLTDSQVASFQIGKLTKVKDNIHGIEKDYVMSELKIDLINPSVGSKIKLGVS